MTEVEKWALISVFNKIGIDDFAKRLTTFGWKILASGGTAKILKEAGIEVRDVADLVGGGAILGHRVVTLSREVHAGLLANVDDPSQIEEMKVLGLPIIDMVVCDFYPLREAINKQGATIDSVVELTDIGGPCMVRSAAKGNRIVVCRPEDREFVLQVLKKPGYVPKDIRQKLRARAEFEVAKYVMDSARFHGAGDFEGFMGERVLQIPKGENGPQSPADLYCTHPTDVLGSKFFRVIEGQPLSYNNWTDIDRLLQTMTHIGAAYRVLGWEPFIVVVVKHGNPCGAAVGRTAAEAVRRAAEGDSLAAFGGLVMTNFPITQRLAKTLITAGLKPGKTQKFDSVIAPEFGEGVKEILERKKGKCRLVVNPSLKDCWSDLDFNRRFRYVRSGFLGQPNYTFVLELDKADVYGPMPKRMAKIREDVLLAWAVCATSNSNTITIVNNRMLIGNGVGQQARVWAAKLAKMRAKDARHAKMLEGSSACSDSFFPYSDAPRILIRAGVKTIFSTSGSEIGDKKVRKLCVEKGVTLFQLPDSQARGFFGH